MKPVHPTVGLIKECRGGNERTDATSRLHGREGDTGLQRDGGRKSRGEAAGEAKVRDGGVELRE